MSEDDDHYEDEGLICQRCGSSYITIEQCWHCFGDGGFHECGAHVWINGQSKGMGGGKNSFQIDSSSGSFHNGSACGACGAWRGELGAEPTPVMFVDHLVEIFREVRRVLKDDGTIWVNLGSSYA